MNRPEATKMIAAAPVAAGRRPAAPPAPPGYYRLLAIVEDIEAHDDPTRPFSCGSIRVDVAVDPDGPIRTAARHLSPASPVPADVLALFGIRLPAMEVAAD